MPGLGLTNSLHASTVALVLVPLLLPTLSDAGDRRRCEREKDQEVKREEEEGLFKTNVVNGDHDEEEVLLLLHLG